MRVQVTPPSVVSHADEATTAQFIDIKAVESRHPLAQRTCRAKAFARRGRNNRPIHMCRHGFMDADIFPGVGRYGCVPRMLV